MSREVNNILIQTYWEIGRIIVEDEQGNLERAEYGKKLSWSHYCELLSISNEKKRSFYEKETILSNWSVRELKRQIKNLPF